jgi:AraC-like DNA-binding protein
MPYHFNYEQLSKQGLCDAFRKHFSVDIKDDLLQVANEMCNIEMQFLMLPGEVEIVFTKYDYHQDVFFTNVPENEQRYTLMVDCTHTNVQEYFINNEVIRKSVEEQNNAYLMNTIFPYRQLRKAGTKGKSLMIFIPTYLVEGFNSKAGEADLLGKFYSLQNKGQSFMMLGVDELKKVESFFYQWEKNKNVLSLAKYTYQLLEWYFNKLIYFFDNNGDTYKLLPTQAQDLFVLQSHIKNNLSESSLDFTTIQDNISTPINKLKQLFEKIHAQSIHEYFKELKLKNAVKILLGTNKNIAEVAYEFGYANPSNFSASFKKYYSLGPNEYRNKYKLTND